MAVFGRASVYTTHAVLLAGLMRHLLLLWGVFLPKVLTTLLRLFGLVWFVFCCRTSLHRQLLAWRRYYRILCLRFKHEGGRFPFSVAPIFAQHKYCRNWDPFKVLCYLKACSSKACRASYHCQQQRWQGAVYSCMYFILPYFLLLSRVYNDIPQHRLKFHLSGEQRHNITELWHLSCCEKILFLHRMSQDVVKGQSQMQTAGGK